MKKHGTYHSFQDIDASRLKKITDGRAEPGKAAPAAKPARKDGAPDLMDEAALFLEAVSGNVDVSMKNPPLPPEEAAPSRDRMPMADETPPSGPASPQPAANPAPAGPNEETLFARAMGGVAPLRARGRELAPPVKIPPGAGNEFALAMDDIFSGKLEFSLEYTDEFIQGHVLGLDPVVLGKLRAGAYSPEGHLDLHGQNLEQAYAALSVFLKEAYQSGKRHLLIITGRGKNSPGGTAVLRERVQAWFTRDPFKRVVLAFCTAKPGDGGAGALYILLRRRKKNQGKIVWDRTPSEEELLL